jgi:hypothetical protein
LELLGEYGLSLRGDRSFLTDLGEVNREHLGTVVVHQVHLLSASDNYERVGT